MQLNQETRQALYALRYEDLLIYLTLNTAISNSRHFGGIVAYESVLKKAKTFNRDDLQWALDLMDEHPELRSYWLRALSILDDSSLPLYLERVDELWERLLALPDMTADIAWESLMSYLDADPGNKTEEGDAFFIVNATTLAILQKTRKGNKRRTATNGVTEMVTYTATQLPEDVEIEFLNTEMADLVVAHSSDVDALVSMIHGEGITHPSAIRYRLDGVLPEVADESDAIANELLVRVQSEARALALSCGTSETSRRLGIIESARRNRNQSALELYARFLSGETTSAETMMFMVEDFDAHRQINLLKDVTMDSLSEYSSILDEHIRRGRFGFNLVNAWYNQALRTAVAVAPVSVVEYIKRDEAAVVNELQSREIKEYVKMVEFLVDATADGQTNLLSEGAL